MGIAKHSRFDARHRKTLFIILSNSLCVIASLEAQEKAIRPNKYACPVTANLFPEQERSADTIKFVFPENAAEIPAGKAKDFSRVAQRISIALMTSDGKDVDITFKWKGAVYTNPWIDWGINSGSFIVKGDGSQNCFFLGPSAGLPGNIPCVEFSLTIPPNVEVREVRLSSLRSEYVSQDCPMPELERQIREAYEDSRQTPQDEVKTARFISLLEKAIPKYDCIVPALFLVDLESIMNWVDYLYQKVDETNKSALMVFAGIFDISSGVVSEIMSDLIWEVLHDRPMFILENWTSIRDYKWNILSSRWLQSPDSNTEMIEIYRDTARKEPKYKSSCDEIIRILSKKRLS
jgi:hypothetical protein